MDDAIFGVSAGRLFILFARNSEKKDGLQSEILRAPRFIDDSIWRKLKHAWHAFDRLAFFYFFADEKRQNKIARA